MEKVTGCILIGGKSSRMGGGIKSLKKINGKSILHRIIEKSQDQVTNLVINSNIDDDNIKKFSIPIFSDLIKGYLGPLAGIHTAINCAKNNNHKWAITFPGDTPFFPINIVNLFLKTSIRKNCSIVLANSNGKNHPVFGIWHTSLEEDLKESIEKNNIRKIDEWVKKHNYAIEYIKNTKYDPFFNINNFNDLLIAKEIDDQILKK
ncbi:MAG: Molybdenum cofactor guanylyltransferase [Alphaproteobacteria bacterium MarineAlpha5_Bin11]|nr:molybdenum cofactor guanylyltransferase [Pelagibacteraceae bacterium]PPR43430.1 MAG: Molybdenum cofactor guanylyltransferase [Alphaproteobacteria bacterium MarineAlpha5_Bin11]|tara:strand:- start:138 stop:752 length:615 start_codon:yes stop_codon:yes gene_type:complete